MSTFVHSLLTARKYYAEIGIDTLPLLPNKKVTEVSEWQIRSSMDLWKDGNKKSNLGIRCGGLQNLAVIDCDENRKAGTYSNIVNFLNGLGIKETQFPIVNSASENSRHIYIKLNKSIDGNYAGPFNADNTPHNKPAEDILRKWYGGEPRISPTEIPQIGEDVEEYFIFENQLNNGWFFNEDDNPNDDPVVQSIISNGGNAIELSPDGIDSIYFGKFNFNLDEYDWLKFDVYAPSVYEYINYWPYKIPLHISVAIFEYDNSGSLRPFKVDISPSYIEGGEYIPGIWQTVQIPIDVFGPSFHKFLSIVLSGGWHGMFPAPVYYIDNIKLIKVYCN
jgi:hypothetical protein